MRNVSNNICREKQNTHFMLSSFFLPANRAAYETMWKNTVQLQTHTQSL